MRIPPDVQIIVNRALDGEPAYDQVHELMAKAILLDRSVRREREIGGLTPRHRKVLDFIEGYIREHRGVSPTFREIAEACGLYGPAASYRVVHEIEARGFLSVRKNGSRGIRLKVAVAA